MPNPLQIKTFQVTGEPAQHASASITVDPGYKILCGGAGLSSPGQGQGWNFLTASYPTSIFTWNALSKDQDTPGTASITVFAIALYDPQDKYDFQIFSATSAPSSEVAMVSVTLPAGYQLVGGGAQANWGDSGQFLTCSAPLENLSGWQARSQSHLHSDPGTVTVFAVGIRARADAPPLEVILIKDATTTPQSGPEGDTGIPAGYTLIGGGASVGVGGDGNLLIASYPDNMKGVVEWEALSHDQSAPDQETITTYALAARVMP